MTSLKNQAADLRAVVVDSARYAVCGQIDVRGPDIFCSTTEIVSGKKFERFRLTYHGSGATRMHIRAVGGQTTLAHQLPPVEPATLTGAMLLTNGSPVIYESNYAYTPKADSSRRRTLIVPAEQMKYGVSVECWAIEPENQDALALALTEPTRDFKLVNYVLADWVRPTVLIVLRTLVATELPDLDKAIAESTEDGGATPIPSLLAWGRHPGHYPTRGSNRGSRP